MNTPLSNISCVYPIENSFTYRIKWDNPYNLFCKKGYIICDDNMFVVMRFEINNKQREIYLWDTKNNNKMTWIWGQWKPGKWHKVQPGILVDQSGKKLAETIPYTPNFANVSKICRSKSFDLHIESRKYTIEWITLYLLWRIVITGESMNIYDENNIEIIKSENPAADYFSCVNKNNDIWILFSVFIVYMLEPPMDCCGE
jgi:hypothetical protein